MRRLAEVLPFINHARIVSSQYKDIPLSMLAWTPATDLPNETLGLRAYAASEFSRRLITVVQPFGQPTVLYPDISPWDHILLSLLPPDTVVHCSIHERDYLPVIQETIRREGVAYCELVNGHVEHLFLPGQEEVFEDMLTDSWDLALGFMRAGFIKLFDTSTTVTEVVMDSVRNIVSVGEELNEVAYGDDVEDKLDVTQDPNEQVVTTYLTQESADGRVLCLQGYTAVAKSALVKAVCKRLGRRMVDIRCVFLDKLDIDGMMRVVASPDDTERLLAATAPMEKLTQCTDEYIKYAKDMVPVVERHIKATHELIAQATDQGLVQRYTKELAACDKCLKNLRFYSDFLPVIFFDEVTRADKAVQAVLVQLLNQKTYKTMKMTKAKIITATNVPLGLPEDFKSIFHTVNIRDSGVLERYTPVNIRPEEVFPRWFKYIKTEEAGFDPIVVEWIDSAPDLPAEPARPLANDPSQSRPARPARTGMAAKAARAYNLELALEIIEKEKHPKLGEVSSQDLGALSFPNYRTWEFVSDHLIAVRNGQRFNPQLVYGFLGEYKETREFVAFVKTRLSEAKKTEVKDSEDLLTETVESSFQSGVPLLLMGMSSIGKTTRVKALEDHHNCIVLPINLAEKDRMQVMGAPTVRPVHDSLTRGTGIPEGLAAELASASKGLNPDMTLITKTAPDMTMDAEITKARSQGKQLVLFFDELNRTDKLTMSAVFEAVSDFRFGGVEFGMMCSQPMSACDWRGDKSAVKRGKCPKCGQPAKPEVITMAACNYGAAYAGGTNNLDPAIAGRFSVVIKNDFDKFDRDFIIKFMRDKKYDPRVISYIESKSALELGNLLATVEARTLTESAPSLRAWESVSRLVSDPVFANNPKLQGRVLLPEQRGPDGKVVPGTGVAITALIQAPTTLQEIEQKLDLIPDNWAGYGMESVTVGGQQTTVRQFVLNIRETYEDFKKKQSDPATTLSGEKLTKKLALFASLFRNVLALNQSALDYRKKEFTTKLGPFEDEDPRGRGAVTDTGKPINLGISEEFFDHFNRETGTKVLGISDLVSAKAIEEYFQAIRVKVHDDHLLDNAFREAMDEFFTYWKSHGGKMDQYQNVMRSVFRNLATGDSRIEFVACYVTHPKFQAFFDHCVDAKLTGELADICAFSVDPAEVASYYANRKVGP